MRTIKINESQRRRLFEAYSEGFSFEELTMIGNGQFAGEDNTEEQFEYCCKYLGEPLDSGSSRVVFQLNDHFVLKLAIGFEGFMQNEREYKVTIAANSELLAKVVYCSEDYSFLVSEYVIPARSEDLEYILGIPYSDVYYQRTKKKEEPLSKNNGDKEIGFDKYFKDIKRYRQKSDVSFLDILAYISGKRYDQSLSEKYDKIINNTPWLKKFSSLVKQYKLEDDLYLSNFGIVNRGGKPMIVILDSGVNENDEDYEYTM
jgi:hypothetical protein